MSLVISKKKTVWWPVSVRVPTDNGVVSVQTFKAQFEIIERTRVDEIAKDATDALRRRASGESDLDGVETDVDVAVLRLALQDAKDLADEDKQPISFDDEVREWMLNTPYVRVGLWKAYSEAVGGRKAKN